MFVTESSTCLPTYLSLQVCPGPCLSPYVGSVWIMCLSIFSGVFRVGLGTSLSPQVFRVGSDTCLSLQVCSGWSQVTWQLPTDTMVDGVVVENRGSSSVLQLSNATWKNSGRYTCEEPSSHQSRHIDIFIPGQGDDENFSYIVHIS